MAQGQMMKGNGNDDEERERERERERDMARTSGVLAIYVEDQWGSSRGDRGVIREIDGYADSVIRMRLDRDELRETERVGLDEALRERVKVATAASRVLIDAAVDMAIEDLLMRYPEARAARSEES